MKKIFCHLIKDDYIKKDTINKKEPFFPYQKKVKIAYFSYSGLYWFFGLLVYIFSLFVMINLSKNGKYNPNDINFFFTPIFNIILVSISWFLLLFAPRKIYKSPKRSSIMFYFSFWFLVVSVLLNAQLQLAYINSYGSEPFYHWINSALVKVVIVLSALSLFGIEIFFWIMRRKFAFMPTDYEIYLQRSNNKKERKARKQLKKQMKKQNAKLANEKA